MCECILQTQTQNTNTESKQSPSIFSSPSHSRSLQISRKIDTVFNHFAFRRSNVRTSVKKTTIYLAVCFSCLFLLFFFCYWLLFIFKHWQTFVAYELKFNFRIFESECKNVNEREKKAVFWHQPKQRCQ